MLEVRDLHAGYGPIRVLHGLSFEVEPQELVALIGANGAGKTTTLRAIIGLTRPSRGEVRLERDNITALGPEETARRGVALVPEGRRIFPGLTVRENLQVAFAASQRASDLKAALNEALTLFPALANRIDMPGWTLSGGEQQMLAIGRAVVANPRLMLLDEPSMGLAPTLVRDTFNALNQLNERGATMLLVEQNAAQALRIADRCFVLENGVISHSGPAAELRDDPAVVKAYLGG